MPVGNSDRGVGLGAGEIMVFADYSQQNFDWWHAQIEEGAYIVGTDDLEDFEHSGLLENNAINLGATIGLSDYWNLTASTILSKRCMTWEGEVWELGEDIPDGVNVGDSKTVHHRSECTDSDFSYDGQMKAFGGQLGDTKINFKYLLHNQGKGPGDRVFFGFGFVLPSSNTLTESPWVLRDHDENPETPKRYSPHRHFYLSDGAYKMSSEFQFFRKRVKIPVFWGGTFGVELPLGESDYGFKPSPRYEFSLLALSGPISFLKTNLFQVSSIGLSVIVSHMTGSEWDGVATKNSRSTVIIPGISILFASKAGTFGLNYQTGEEKYSLREGDIEESTNIQSITLSYRRILNTLIDALYW